uniref:Cytochrome P450, family 7, subfamily B, polypeptide 1 n=2 Tax=Tetraodon nigroviridis TaxID=99883 RepID=H3CDD3_TETNG
WMLYHCCFRRVNEPPLDIGWIPYIGKAVEFGKDAHGFLLQQKKKFGDVFTILIAGKYMTFIMDPLMYPNIIKHGRQLDFHSFSDTMAPLVFGYPPVRSYRSPSLHEDIQRAFKLLQGDHLCALTESMMGNLMMLLRQQHLGLKPKVGSGWKTDDMYEFCSRIMFEATFNTLYGTPQDGGRHGAVEKLRRELFQFDSWFPLLVAGIPIGLLRQAKTSRNKLLKNLLPNRISSWSNRSQFISRRQELVEKVDVLTDMDRAAHHFAMLWASVANTIPACFWSMYNLVSHPDALRVVRQQIFDVLKLSGVEFSVDKDVTLSKDFLDKLLYLESAINESLRLSSASMNIRVAQEDFSLHLKNERSVKVRKDDIIVLYPQSLHMDPEVYEDPQMFQFDRYIQDNSGKSVFFKDGQKLKYYLMPFGSGSSMCPGRHFAINEIKQFLCLMLLYFDLELDLGQTRATVDSSRAGLGILFPSTNVRFRYRLQKNI